ncbi:archaemetzincin family Zn-dependent metalloprotease [Desulfurobacterium sp. TC5-1]|uniref:archaemetzincin family Zn-dependent metalloprotease n=1 Tax=Desulfurobacterium sp. TC5-1 TaxID=1158318 RepID=UPI0003B487F0|nr:archaemetzincin family Zn-dependent metalloprotease [Desulfurobacterium sp. TC5-1]
MNVCIVPEKEIDKELLNYLEEKLSEIFGKARIKTFFQIPEYSFDIYRRQFNAELAVKSLPFPDGRNCGVVLGITEKDLFADELNFVFGIAEPFSGRAIISIARLKNSFYNLPEDKELFKLRTLKEAVHEIGHLLGLPHCPNRQCVMSFSNSIIDVDRKSYLFCPKCQNVVNSAI